MPHPLEQVQLDAEGALLLCVCAWWVCGSGAPGNEVALGSGDAQEEYAAKNIQKLVKLDKLDKSCAKNEKRVTPSFQRLIDNAYTRKRLQKRRFEAYLKVIEDRKQQCASHPTMHVLQKMI